jgi:hypothetical protein
VCPSNLRRMELFKYMKGCQSAAGSIRQQSGILADTFLRSRLTHTPSDTGSPPPLPLLPLPSVSSCSLPGIVTRVHLELGAKPHINPTCQNFFTFDSFHVRFAALISQRGPLRVSAWHPQPRPSPAPVTSSEWLEMQLHGRNGRRSLLGQFYPAHMIFGVVAVMHPAISSHPADF